MAGKCEVCGKGTTHGRSIQHQHSGKWYRKAPKTNKPVYANVHKTTIYENGVPRRISICTRCLRTRNRVVAR